MKTIKTIITTFCILAPVCAIAQDSTPASFPYYVKVLQTYTFPGTQWTSSPNEVEQVIAETPEFFIVTTSEGTSVQLPKSIAARITEKEAADLLMAERKMHHDRYMALLKQAEEYAAQVYQERQQIIQMIQMATALQKQNSGSGSSTSDMREQLKLIQDLQDMMKTPDKRRIPNQNRYEIEVR